jgi:hypothetical protein
LEDANYADAHAEDKAGAYEQIFQSDSGGTRNKMRGVLDYQDDGYAFAVEMDKQQFTKKRGWKNGFMTKARGSMLVKLIRFPYNPKFQKTKDRTNYKETAAILEQKLQEGFVGKIKLKGNWDDSQNSFVGFAKYVALEDKSKKVATKKQGPGLLSKAKGFFGGLFGGSKKKPSKVEASTSSDESYEDEDEEDEDDDGFHMDPRSLLEQGATNCSTNSSEDQWPWTTHNGKRWLNHMKLPWKKVRINFAGSGATVEFSYSIGRNLKHLDPRKRYSTGSFRLEYKTSSLRDSRGKTEDPKNLYVGEIESGKGRYQIRMRQSECHGTEYEDVKGLGADAWARPAAQTKGNTPAP